MSHYQKHVFFCTNQRDPGVGSCGDFQAREACNYVKDRIKRLGLDLDNRVRINSAGCLGRCDQGPTIVIYPEEVWYTYVDQADLDEIIDEHLVHGRVVQRLRI